MLPRKKTIIILAIFILVITGLRLAFLSYQKPIDHPKAVNGVLDLREWSIPQNKTISLSGEWDLFPSHFIQPDSERNSSSLNTPEATTIQVPGAWEASFPDRVDSFFQYGTYRLHILIDENDEREFKLRIKRINDASAVYVNGQLAARNGIPSVKQDSHEARIVPYSIKLPAGSDRIEIIIHVSSHAGEGGIVESIQFGTVQAVNQLTMLSIGLQLGLCIVFLIHGLYAAMLYFFGVANKGLLYFAIIVLMAVFIVLVADDKMLFVWLPMPYEIHIKISILAYIAVVAFIPPLFKHIFSITDSKKVLRLAAVFNMAYALFVLIAPAHTLRSTFFLLSISFLISVIVAGTILYRAYHRNEDTIFVLIGLIAVGVNVAWTIVLGRFSIEQIHYPFDLAFAVFAFAAFWFKRFFRAGHQSRLLAEKLQLLNQQKDDFLVNTSHELRNPLHGIMNISQSIMDDPRNPVPVLYRKRLEIQVAVARRMSLMLDDLIDITRLRESTIRLNLRNVQLQPLVNGIFDILRFMLDGKPITLKIDIANDFPDVDADENRLSQILFNLLHNAVKFTDVGEISVRAEAKNGIAYISIRDTGIGMNEEMLSRIFMPYEQGDTSRIRAVGGFGLGLSIAKQLIVMHGGSLTVDSSPGQGSEFTFSLRVSEKVHFWKEPQQSFERSDASVTPDIHDPISMPDTDSQINKPKILVVDDDNINLNILLDVLRSVQYEVVSATNAEEALARLETGSFDLIVSDVMMPHISGYELTRLIRERFTISELPILLLTARNRSVDILAGYQAGANDYVTKPIDAWELKSRVRALIELKMSFEERLRMEAAWLQAQIQPHFLYNTINSIAALGTMDIEKMQKLLGEFSNYLRTCFDFHNSDQLVSIERELDLVRSYLYIEKERFEDRLEIQWILDYNLTFVLPPLSIQTLVENAVNHGLLPRSRGGILTVLISDAMDHVEVSVKDNGVGMKEEIISQALEAPSAANVGIGLRNTDRRLKQLYNRGLQISSIPGQGTTVTFQLPKSGKKIRNAR